MNIRKKDKLEIMAVINVTPDSFYDGGKYFDGDKVNVDKVLNAVGDAIEEGAAIIDVGGESTRPGFRPISEEEELERIITVIDAIKKNYDIPLSVDTYKPGVAKAALEYKVDMINDIGFLPDNMLKTLKDSDSLYCLTHNRFINPPKCDESTIMIDVLNSEINDKLIRLREYGISDDRIVIDPGIGFGKSNDDDIMILKNLEKLKVHGLPILIGVSNKSCIEYISHTDKDDRLEGTLAATARAFYSGVSYVRVHDVKANYRFIKMLEAISS